MSAFKRMLLVTVSLPALVLYLPVHKDDCWARQGGGCNCGAGNPAPSEGMK